MNPLISILQHTPTHMALTGHMTSARELFHEMVDGLEDVSVYRGVGAEMAMFPNGSIVRVTDLVSMRGYRFDVVAFIAVRPTLDERTEIAPWLAAGGWVISL